MARKAMTKLYQKMLIIEKLIALNITSEDDIKKLTPVGLLSAKDLSFDDINLIRDIQENVNNNTLFSFLTEGMSEVKADGE